MNGHSVGYVYIMKSEHIRGLKIGFTNNSIYQRESELNTTGVASPLRAVYYLLVERPQLVEKKAHEALDQWRISSNREFFDCDTQTAILKIRDSAHSQGLKIYEETSGDKRSSKIELDLSVWNDNAKRVVEKIIDRVTVEIKSRALALDILSDRVPSFERDINKKISWVKEVDLIYGRIYETASPALSIGEINELKYWCGAVHVDIFEVNKNVLVEWVKHQYSSLLEDHRVAPLRRAIRGEVSGVVNSAVVALKASMSIKFLSEKIDSTKNKLAQLEDEVISAQISGSISLDTLRRKYRRYELDEIKQEILSDCDEISSTGWKELDDPSDVVLLLRDSGVSVEHLGYMMSKVLESYVSENLDSFVERLEDRFDGVVGVLTAW